MPQDGWLGNTISPEAEDRNLQTSTEIRKQPTVSDVRIGCSSSRFPQKKTQIQMVMADVISPPWGPARRRSNSARPLYQSPVASPLQVLWPTGLGILPRPSDTAGPTPTCQGVHNSDCAEHVGN